VLEIVTEDGCTQFLLKGVVQQKKGWLHGTTEVKVSVKEGATTTCQGEHFSSASATAVSKNGCATHQGGRSLERAYREPKATNNPHISPC
jgi:hypothetical protein